MKKIIFAAAALMLVAGSAAAGMKSDQNVVLSWTAKGALGTVRNSSYYYEDIGCWTEASSSYYGTTFYGQCWATDSTGSQRGCYSSDPDMVRQMSSIKGDSVVEFLWSGANNSDCSFVKVWNGSDYRPKAQ
jgi:hypothetical protein